MSPLTRVMVRVGVRPPDHLKAFLIVVALDEMVDLVDLAWVLGLDRAYLG